ncbi:MAG: phosphoribosylformimino-5-aminoimidazole carboxamide ribotide isomerase [Planctomycetota bacterium]
MTRFRPCIDLHDGTVKQIVGGTLGGATSDLRTNFASDRDAAWYAQHYRDDALTGGHVIKLGPGNDAAARSALAAWPGGLQLGGGVDATNAADWIEAGAAAVIVTSWLFPDARLDCNRARALADAVGAQRVVIDLSCRRIADGWVVVTDRWRTLTEHRVDAALLAQLAPFCGEFLVHAVDVEGLCRGIDGALVTHLAQISRRPLTYAGGGRELADLDRVAQLSDGRLDLTFGSALDIFGGSGVRYADCVAWNRSHTG